VPPEVREIVIRKDEISSRWGRPPCGPEMEIPDRVRASRLGSRGRPVTWEAPGGRCPISDPSRGNLVQGQPCRTRGRNQTTRRAGLSNHIRAICPHHSNGLKKLPVNLCGSDQHAEVTVGSFRAAGVGLVVLPPHRDSSQLRGVNANSTNRKQSDHLRTRQFLA
jgi:hypothetical protein